MGRFGWLALASSFTNPRWTVLAALCQANALLPLLAFRPLTICRCFGNFRTWQGCKGLCLHADQASAPLLVLLAHPFCDCSSGLVTPEGSRPTVGFAVSAVLVQPKPDPSALKVSDHHVRISTPFTPFCLVACLAGGRDPTCPTTEEPATRFSISASRSGLPSLNKS